MPALDPPWSAVPQVDCPVVRAATVEPSDAWLATFHTARQQVETELVEEAGRFELEKEESQCEDLDPCFFVVPQPVQTFTHMEVAPPRLAIPRPAPPPPDVSETPEAPVVAAGETQVDKPEIQEPRRVGKEREDRSSQPPVLPAVVMAETSAPRPEAAHEPPVPDAHPRHSATPRSSFVPGHSVTEAPRATERAAPVLGLRIRNASDPVRKPDPSQPDRSQTGWSQSDGSQPGHSPADRPPVDRTPPPEPASPFVDLRRKPAPADSVEVDAPRHSEPEEPLLVEKLKHAELAEVQIPREPLESPPDSERHFQDHASAPALPRGGGTFESGNVPRQAVTVPRSEPAIKPAEIALAQESPVEDAERSRPVSPASIKVKVDLPESAPVHVQFVERRGEIHVMVRSNEPGVSTRLASHIGELATGLETAHSQVEPWAAAGDEPVPDQPVELPDQQAERDSATPISTAERGGNPDRNGAFNEQRRSNSMPEWLELLAEREDEAVLRRFRRLTRKGVPSWRQ